MITINNLMSGESCVVRLRAETKKEIDRLSDESKLPTARTIAELVYLGRKRFLQKYVLE